MRGFYMDEAFTGSPSDLQHISHDTNFTAKQWVDNTSASLAPIEATSTASQPYTVGKRLVYGGRLYKVTQAIAQGGTLTPGTNITPDTVDEELSTINTHLANLENWEVAQKIAIGKRGNNTVYKYIMSGNVDSASFFNAWYGFISYNTIGMSNIISCRLLQFGNLYDNNSISFRAGTTSIEMTQNYAQSGVMVCSVEIIGY